MYALKIPLKDAEKAKRILKSQKLIDEKTKFFKEDGFLYIPLKEKIDVSFGEIIEKDLERKESEKGSIKDILSDKLSQDEVNKINRAFEIVGSIAIVEIPKEIEEKEYIIAEAIMKANKNIKTVVKKISGHEGIFRIQKYKHLLGENTTQSILHENNVRLKVDISKAYFSSKMAHERARIASLIKKGEKILCMFSGVGPYPCVIAKNSEAEQIVAIELNEDAHKLALENIKLNKINNVLPLIGDVKYVVPVLKEKGFLFDRIIMPAPKTGEEFIELPFLVAKKGTVVHLYTFCKENEIAHLKEKIEERCKELKKNIEIINIVKCGQVGVRNYRVCVDFCVL